MRTLVRRALPFSILRMRGAVCRPRVCPALRGGFCMMLRLWCRFGGGGMVRFWPRFRFGRGRCMVMVVVVVMMWGRCMMMMVVVIIIPIIRNEGIQH